MSVRETLGQPQRRRRTAMDEDTQALVEDEDVSHEVSVKEGGLSVGDSKSRIEEETHPIPKRQPLSSRCTKQCKYWTMVAFVTALGLIMIVAVATTLGLWSERQNKTCIDTLNEKDFVAFVFPDPAKGKNTTQ